MNIRGRFPSMRAACRGAFALLAFALLVLARPGATLAQAAAPAFEAGQSVEVREGDTWSAATIVQREGRRFQIRYDDGTEEWVASDRMRSPGGAGDTAAPSAPQTDQGPDASNAAPRPAARPEPKLRQKVKAKWGSTWWDATITRKVGTNRWEVLYSDRTKGTVGRDEILLPGEKEPAGKSPFEQQELDYPVVEVELQTMRDVARDGTPWQSAVDPVPQRQWPARPFSLRNAKADFFDEVDIAFNGSHALLSIYDRRRRGDAPSRAIPINLSTGQAGAEVQVPAASLPLGISPDGALIAARANGFHPGTKRRVDLWAPAGSEVRHVLSFEPFADESFSPNQDVVSVTFIDATHLLTTNREPQTILWEISVDAPQHAKAIWRHKPSVSSTGATILSPGGKFLFASDATGISAIEATTGNPVGSLTAGNLQAIAVTPDGAMLIGTGNGRIRTWNLQTGGLERDVTLPNGLHGASLMAVDPQFVLIDEYLYDLSKGTVVWQYSGVRELPVVDGRVVIADLKNRSQMALVALPHDAARRMAGQIQEPGYAVKPGSAVSLDIQLDAGADDQRQVIEALTKQLRDVGINIAGGQPVRLVARTESGTPEQRTYRRFGFGARGGDETVTVTPKITRIRWEKDGKPLWESSATSSGSMHLQLKEGQSAQDAINEQSRFNVGFLKTLQVPTKVTLASSKDAAGRSTVTVNGVQE